MALLYGLVTRLAFTWEPFENYLHIVSWAYLILVPFGFGALTTFLGCRWLGRSWFWIYLAPSLVVMLGLILSVLTKLEAVLCVVVAAPVFVPMSFVGGILMGVLFPDSTGKLRISFVMLLPFLASPLEQLWKQPQEIVSIRDHVDIRADAAAIWREIASVPPIQPSELPGQWIYVLDFPRPISAEIDREGVGAKRWAVFERGVAFYETVTEWVPERRLAFSIQADPAFIPHTAFDQHIIVGGRFYDVLDGQYDIEATPEGCRLILTSTHRLSTPFNFYAGWWSEWVMNQIQGSILTVIKNRAERAL